MSRIILLFLLSLCVFWDTRVLAQIQDAPGKIHTIPVRDDQVVLKEVAILPKILKEASGFERTSNYFWSHNDDGIPALYCLDTLGNLVRAVQLNAMNRGWEDLTQDDEGNFYIGGFGNNKNDKKELKIYKIPPPEKIQDAITIPEIIQYSYSDQKAFPPDNTNKNFDVDAMVALGDALYLFTKNRSTPFKSYSKVYKLSTSPGQQVAQLVDSIYLGEGAMINNWITSADVSPDKNILSFLLHGRILFIRNFKPDRFSSGVCYELNLNHYSHKAGICFNDNDTVYIVDELEMGMIGGKMYKVDLVPHSRYLRPKLQTE